MLRFISYLIGIDHVRDGDGHGDADERLGRRGDGDGLGPDAGGGALAEDGEADGADREVVGEVPDEHEGGLGPGHAGGAAGDAVQDADEELQDHQGREAVEVDGAPAEAGQEIPRNDGADESDG